MYRLYIAGSGALKVAESLNARGFWTRKGNLWDKARSRDGRLFEIEVALGASETG
jgi:hypothetical protein